jgi:hypothetical protein
MEEKIASFVDSIIIEPTLDSFVATTSSSFVDAIVAATTAVVIVKLIGIVRFTNVSSFNAGARFLILVN